MRFNVTLRQTDLIPIFQNVIFIRSTQQQSQRQTMHAQEPTQCPFTVKIPHSLEIIQLKQRNSSYENLDEGRHAQIFFVDPTILA